MKEQDCDQPAGEMDTAKFHLQTKTPTNSYFSVLRDFLGDGFS